MSTDMSHEHLNSVCPNRKSGFPHMPAHSPHVTAPSWSSRYVIILDLILFFTLDMLLLLLLLLLLSCFSRVRLCETPETAAHQAPPSLGFFRKEHWSGLPFPSPMHESEKWKWSRSVVSDSQWPHGLQPTMLLRWWDFPGKSTGVGFHCLLPQYVAAATGAAKSLQSCLTLFDPRDSSPPGSPVPGILQVRTLEWVSISFSNVWKCWVQIPEVSKPRHVMQLYHRTWLGNFTYSFHFHVLQNKTKQNSLSINNSRCSLNSCASSRWCHPAISSSVVPFSSCPQSLPASESFPISQLFTWGGQSTGVSA